MKVFLISPLLVCGSVLLSNVAQAASGFAQIECIFDLNDATAFQGRVDNSNNLLTSANGTTIFTRGEPNPNFFPPGTPNVTFDASSYIDGLVTNAPRVLSPPQYYETLEFTLDTSVHTQGYDLTSLETFVGGLNGTTMSSGTGVQAFRLEIFKVGNTGANPDYGYTSLGDYQIFAPPALFNQPLGDEVTSLMSLDYTHSSQSIPVPTGVNRIRITTDDGLALQEIQVMGTPTGHVPEPSTSMLLGFAGFALMMRRK